MAPTHLFVVVTAVALLHVATPARGQTTCEVTSTFAGRWYRAELSCNSSASGTPRAAAVKSQALQSCPLLAGDRVAVEYENDDPRRQPQVTNVDARGSGGPSSGAWCSNGLAPGLFTGPCALVDSPPRELRTPVAGGTFVRTATITWFRDTNDSRTSVSPGGCSPIALTSGVYRIYITQEIRHTTWEACANEASRLCEASTYETNRFEGGIFVDEDLAPSAVVVDVGPFVRGWNVIEQAPKAAPVALPPGAIPEHRTRSLVMFGLRTFRAHPMTMSGARSMRTVALGMTGLRSYQASSPLTMTGVRVYRTHTLEMTGDNSGN